MNRRVLFIDDEENVLHGFRRQLRREFEVKTAVGGAAGVALLRSEAPYAVVVSDMHMPGVDGLEVLARAKRIAPTTVRMMLTGRTDQQTAAAAVNSGNIFRFLTKPCATDALIQALEAGVRQHQLLTAEHDLLEDTLRGAIKVLTDILSLASPTAFGRASRVRRLVLEMAEQTGVADTWTLEMAAMLSQVGCVTVPEDTLDRLYHGHALSTAEQKILEAHPQVGAELISNIPRLEHVAEIIAYQDKGFDGSGLPAGGPRGEEIPFGARMLKVALDVDAMMLAGATETNVLEQMHGGAARYDPAAVNALERSFQARTRYHKQTVTLADLAPGMVLVEDVRSTSGVLITAKGLEVTAALVARLHNFGGAVDSKTPMLVLVPLGGPAEGRDAA